MLWYVAIVAAALRLLLDHLRHVSHSSSPIPSIHIQVVFHKYGHLQCSTHLGALVAAFGITLLTTNLAGFVLLITARQMIKRVNRFNADTELFEAGRLDRSPKRVDFSDALTIFSFVLCCVAVPATVFCFALFFTGGAWVFRAYMDVEQHHCDPVLYEHVFWFLVFVFLRGIWNFCVQLYYSVDYWWRTTIPRPQLAADI
jgi:hypothetical protein